MAGVFCDDFAPAEELSYVEDFSNFESSKDCVQEVQNKDEKENKEQEKATGNEVKDETVSADSSAHSLQTIFEVLASSDVINDRRMCAQTIVDQLHIAESKEELLSALSRMCKLGDDEEFMVRSELMQNLPYIALFCKEHSEDLNAVIRQQIVPYTVKLLTDEQIMVRKIGHSSLKILLENNIIDNTQLTHWICPLISELVTSGNHITSEDLRTEDVSVMCKMIPFIGKEITEKLFLSPFISLCCDESFHIRKVCTMNIGSVCKVLGTETTESTLLPAFLNLCNDSLYCIRKECANVFLDVASCVSTKTRTEILPHIFISLLDDDCRVVELAAYQSLGGFIATFSEQSTTDMQCTINISPNLGSDKSPSKEMTNITDSLQEQNNVQRNSIKSSELKDASNLNAEKCDQTSIETFKQCNVNAVHLEAELLEKKCQVNNLTNSDISSINGHQSEERLNIDVEMTENQNRSNSQTTVSLDTSRDINLIIENKNDFNNFQFWRTPLPEVELNLDSVTDKYENNQLSVESCKNISSESSTETQPEFRLGIRQNLRRRVENRNLIYAENSATVIDLSSYARKFQMTEELTFSKSFVNEQDIVPSELLSKYLSGLDDDEKKEIFAYSFPAVACTLGKKYWSRIKPACLLLAEDLKYTVRRTVASFLHELAFILDHNTVLEDLLPMFLELSKDVDSVRIKVLTYLPMFLQHLSPDERKQFLHFFEELLFTMDSDSNWRFRFTIAEKLVLCVDLFNLSDVQEYFLPITLALLNDKASDVRRSAIKLLVIIIKSFLEDSAATYEKQVDYLLDSEISMYKEADKWLQRQMYVFICQELASSESLPSEVYIDKIIPGLFSLAWDPVPNVRLAVARCFSLTLFPLGYLPSIQKSHYQLLLQVMYSLQSDVDRDVRHFAHLCAGAFNVLPQKKLSPVWISES